MISQQSYYTSYYKGSSFGALKYSYCANNPMKFVDPTGEDWYQDSETGSVCWQKGNAASIDVEGVTYNNIGETYSHTIGNATYNYNQMDVESIDYNTNADFIPQTTGTGCKVAADAMVSSSGANPSPGRAGEILMTNHDANGRATTPTDNANAGIDRIENQIMNGYAITVGLDYKSLQQHNKAPNGDGMTDHFIAIIGMTVNLKNGVTSYRFYDPGSSSNGNNPSNTITSQKGFLVGNTAFTPNAPFKVTTVRKNL